ncbi:unnamed protein product [Sympodiomycopsis kandeliae]
MIAHSHLLTASRLGNSVIRGMTNPEIIRAGARTMVTFIASRPGSNTKNSNLVARRPLSTSFVNRYAAESSAKKTAAKAKAPKKEKTAEQKALAEARKEKAKLAEQKRTERAKAKVLKEKEKERKQKEKARVRLAKEKELERKAKERERKAKERTKPLKKWELRDENGRKIPLPTHNKPARTTSFVEFIKQQIAQNKSNPEFIGKNGSFSSTLLFKSASSSWSGMSDAEKRPYKEAADKHNADYPRRLTEWENSLSQMDIARLEAWDAEQRKAYKAANKKAYHALAPKDPTRPIRPLTAFFRFLSEYRSRSTDASVAEMAKNGSAEWRALSEQEKKPYEEAASKDFDIWRQTQKQWLEQRGL